MAPPRCKCAEEHHTAGCKKSKDTLAKCANCSGAHPANYGACPKHPKNLKKERQRRERQKAKQAESRRTNIEQTTFTQSTLSASISYGGAVKSHLTNSAPKKSDLQYEYIRQAAISTVDASEQSVRHIHKHITTIVDSNIN